MNIWLTRHGQTNYNLQRMMQGRIDEPLNDTGRAQARAAREKIRDVRFDAVYASPLDRAVETASIIADTEKENIIIDKRIIEVDFGPYECREYNRLGLRMTLYWAVPEIFPAPKGVENIPSMIRRSTSFLKELEKKPYKDVLVVCHGGIIRALCGYLMDRRSGIYWRPKPKNCEIRVFESINGAHRELRLEEAVAAHSGPAR